MKLLMKIPVARQNRKKSGFTLLEMMFSVGIYTILLIGVLVSLQIFALRVYTLAATKLSATKMSRQALNAIRDDIRQCKYAQVGHADNSGNFTPYTGTALAPAMPSKFSPPRTGISPRPPMTSTISRPTTRAGSRPIT